MKLSEWFRTGKLGRTGRQSHADHRSPDFALNHISHTHWKKPARKSRRLRLRANRWRIQLLSRRRNRGNS